MAYALKFEDLDRSLSPPAASPNAPNVRRKMAFGEIKPQVPTIDDYFNIASDAKLSAEQRAAAFHILDELTDKEFNANALYYCGQCYEQGYGCAPNLLKAFECYGNAAVDGHIASADKFVAWVYENKTLPPGFNASTASPIYAEIAVTEAFTPSLRENALEVLKTIADSGMSQAAKDYYRYLTNPPADDALSCDGMDDGNDAGYESSTVGGEFRTVSPTGSIPGTPGTPVHFTKSRSFTPPPGPKR